MVESTGHDFDPYLPGARRRYFHLSPPVVARGFLKQPGVHGDDATGTTEPHWPRPRLEIIGAPYEHHGSIEHMFPTSEDAQRTTALEVEEVALAYSTGLEPAAIGRAQLDLEMHRLARSVKAITASLALLAAHKAMCGNKDHAAQVVKDLALLSGTSSREAETAVRAARALRSLPDVDQAARAGRLSAPQLGMVTKAGAVNPGETSRLLSLAGTSSLSELANEATKVCLAASDAEARREAAHAGRYLRDWSDETGWHIVGRATTEYGALIMGALRAHGNKVFKQARAEERREAPEAYLMDALKNMATSGGEGDASIRVDLSVRVDHSALIRGEALPGEACEIEGVGPTTPQAIVEMLETHDPFIKAILTKGKDVASVTHLGRRPNRAQLTALQWIYPTCAAEGCGRSSSWLQSDHREDWCRTHYTTLQLLDRLCPHHHRMKTHQGWLLVKGKGKRPFVGPDDPRHPRHGTPEEDVGPPPPSSIPERPSGRELAPAPRTLPAGVPVTERPVPEWQSSS